MKSKQSKEQEKERISALTSYNILDTLPEEDFNHLVELAAIICGTQYALLSFVAEERQWFKAHYGLNLEQTTRDISFCSHAIENPNEILIIEDARLDKRFKTNPLTLDDPNIVFYAGVPLVSPKGYALGTICVLDKEKKKLSEAQIKSLKFLNHQVMILLELRLKEIEQQRLLDLLEETNNELNEKSFILKDYKQAIDAAAIVAITDPHGIITYVNQKFCDISGYSEEELLGKNQRIVNSGHHNHDFWKEFWSSISSGKVWSGEIKNKTKNGEFYWVETTVIPFLNQSDNQPVQYLSIRKDITAYKATMDQLLNSIINDQEQDREVLSHDIHEGIAQYLTAITYKVELIAESTLDAETRMNLGETHSHLLNCVEELRMLSLNLMPITLLETGLIPALEQYFRSKSEEYNSRLDTSFTNTPKDNLPVHALITIYRSIISFTDYVLLETHHNTIHIEIGAKEHFQCVISIHGITNESDVNGDFDVLNHKYVQFKKRTELCGGSTHVVYDYENQITKVVISFS